MSVGHNSFMASGMFERIVCSSVAQSCLTLCDHPMDYIYVCKHWWIWIRSISSVQSLSRVQLFVTPRTAACQASLSITKSWSPLKPTSIGLMMPFNHLILCRPLVLLPSIFPSIRVFSNESALSIRCPKYWSFSFNISPSNYIWKMLHYMFPWEGLSIFSIPEVLKSSAVKNSVYLYLIQIFINIFVYVSLFG